MGDPIVVAHGIASFAEHDDQPFRISGVPTKTGTPAGRTVVVGPEAIYVDWQGGAQISGCSTPPEVIREMDLTPGAITAAMIGVESRLEVLALRSAINDRPNGPLHAILPGVALQEVWGIVGVAGTAPVAVAVAVRVVVTTLLGMAAGIFAGLIERRREMAILRTIGARPGTIVGLLMLEAVVMAVAASLPRDRAPLRGACGGAVPRERLARSLPAHRAALGPRGGHRRRRDPRRGGDEPRARLARLPPVERDERPELRPRTRGAHWAAAASAARRTRRTLPLQSLARSSSA